MENSPQASPILIGCAVKDPRLGFVRRETPSVFRFSTRPYVKTQVDSNTSRGVWAATGSSMWHGHLMKSIRCAQPQQPCCAGFLCCVFLGSARYTPTLLSVTN